MNEREIFMAAFDETDPAVRAALLDHACEADPGLRDRIEGLLRKAAGAGSFLETPARAGDTPRPDAAPTATLPPAAVGPAGPPGTRIGPYRLIELIGEGGMGTVLRAEQEKPVCRLVALKIIRPGMDSAQVLARFEAERQALALMDHPSIAKVLDAGATPDGRPFFVMELVDGQPLTGYCNARAGTVAERLGLFQQVCQAVQHAHQKGVIHRDLKPSNILVAEYDGKPVPKVIDFGVAKATGGRLTDKTVFTGFGTVVGTPAYMSPEQADPVQADVDTRSDVYSLGVVLYELLTGTTPLDLGRTVDMPLLEVLRRVREEDPPRPSARRADGPRVPRPDELDWIAMKCLEKDRTRRYETAIALAQDVGRYLADEPVQACPPSATYRMGKFARRNKAALAVAATVAAALLVAVAALAVATARIAEALGDKTRALDDANSARSQTEQANGELGRTLVALTAQQQKTKQAHDEERRTNYDHLIAQADREWSLNNLASAEAALAQCPAEFRGWEWHYLNRRMYTEALVVGGPGAQYMGAAYSPDGKYLAVAGDGVKVVDADTGRDVRALASPLRGTKWSPLAFSHDGQRVAVFRTTQGTRGNELIGLVSVLDVATGREVYTCPLPHRTLPGIAYSPDGKCLAAVQSVLPGGGPSDPITVKLWDAGSGVDRQTLTGSGTRGLQVAFSGDGRRVAAGDTVWEAETGREVLKVRSTSAILAFGRGDQMLACLGLPASTVRVVDARGGQLLSAFSRTTDEFDDPISLNYAHSLAFHPGNFNLLAFPGSNRTVKLWSLSTGQEVETFRGHRGYITAVTFRPGGQHLAAAASDGTVRVWRLGQGYPSLGLPLPVGFADGRSASFRPHQDGDVQRSELVVSEFPGGRTQYTIRPVDTEMKWAYSPAGRLAAVRGKRTLLVWDTADGRELFRRESDGNAITAMDLSRDGRRVLAGDGFTVWVYDTANGVVLLRLEQRNSPGRVALSPNGDRFACFGGANAEQVVSIQIRDTATGDLLWTLQERARAVTRVIFSPDGRLLASVAGSRITLWDLTTGREVRALAGHAMNTHSLAFSPDGQRLVSGGGDRSVKIWDPVTGRELLVLRGHRLYVSDVSFSADGHRLLSRGSDLRIWDGAPRPAEPGTPP